MIALYPYRLNGGGTRSGTPPWSLLSAASQLTRRFVTKLGWFFDDYLALRDRRRAGTIAREPDFILDYWGVPTALSDCLGTALVPGKRPLAALREELQKPIARRWLRLPRCVPTKMYGLSRNGAPSS